MDNMSIDRGRLAKLFSDIESLQYQIMKLTGALISLDSEYEHYFDAAEEPMSYDFWCAAHRVLDERNAAFKGLDPGSDEYAELLREVGEIEEKLCL